MKALTIRQPWASLIAAGVKTIETRSWSTKYRGRLAIHAGLSFHPFDDAHARLVSAGVAPMDALVACSSRRIDIVPRGVVVATCTLADVVPMIELADEPPGSGGFVYVDPDFIQVHDDTDDSAPRYLEAERHLGMYGSGRYAWLLTDITRCDPVPAKGRQGLWDWNGGELV